MSRLMILLGMGVFLVIPTKESGNEDTHWRSWTIVRAVAVDRSVYPCHIQFANGAAVVDLWLSQYCPDYHVGGLYMLRFNSNDRWRVKGRHRRVFR